MRELLRLLQAELAAGRPAAVATIVFQEGSAPRGAGSKLVAGPQGLLGGTTGGGLAEGRTIAACIDACRTGRPAVLEFTMSGTLAAKSEMICGGLVRVLIEPFLPAAVEADGSCTAGGTAASTPTAEGASPSTAMPVVCAAQTMAVMALEAAKGAGCRIVRPFPPEKTAWTLLLPDGSCAGAPLPAAVADSLRAQSAALAEAAVLTCGGAAYFVEACQPPERMIIAGGGHVSRPTAHFGALTGFAVHVLDDRPEFADAARFPEAVGTRVTPEYAECFSSLSITARDYVIIVTRGHLFDGEVLAQALRTPAGYIGMIGSSRKRAQIYARLREQGVTEADLARVHSPIGLSIGAETPEEIAVSILAECIAHRRRDNAHNAFAGNRA